MLEKMRVITSTYELKMKFSIESGIGKIGETIPHSLKFIDQEIETQEDRRPK